MIYLALESNLKLDKKQVKNLKYIFNKSAPHQAQKLYFFNCFLCLESIKLTFINWCCALFLRIDILIFVMCKWYYLKIKNWNVILIKVHHIKRKNFIILINCWDQKLFNWLFVLDVVHFFYNWCSKFYNVYNISLK